MHLRAGSWTIRLLCGTLLLCAATAAQEVGPPPATEPVPLAAPSEAPPTLQAVRDRITELESSTEGDEAQREELVDLLRQIIAKLEARDASRERTKAYQQAVETAPVEAARLRQLLEPAPVPEGGPAPAEAPPPEFPEDLDTLQQLLVQVQGELTAARNRQSELDRRLQDEENRPEPARAQLAEARTILQQVESELATGAAPSAESGDEARFERWLLLARREASAAEIQMLEQELLSNPTRIELLRLRRDVSALEVARVEERVARLEGEVNQVRKELAEEAQREAEERHRLAIGKHPLIQAVAQENAEITAETAKTSKRIEAVAGQRDAVAKQLQGLKKDNVDAARLIDLGMTHSLGTALLEKRRSLPNPASFEDAAEDRVEELRDVRTQLFFIEGDLAALADPVKESTRLLTPEQLASVAEENRADVARELEALLVQQRAHLEQEASVLRDYVKAVGELEALERDLLATIARLTALLDENLLWIPNAGPIGMDTLKQLPGDLAWLISPAVWEDAATVAFLDLQRRAPLYALVTIALGSLVLSRRRLSDRLAALAQQIGRVRQDGMQVTVSAFLLHVAQALPFPAAVGFLGWRLTVVSDEGETSAAIGYGILAVCALTFVAQFLRVLFHDSGVAFAHFRWGERVRKLLRKHLPWFLGIAIPTVFVVTMTQQQPQPLYRHGLGRVAFVLLMVATAGLAWRLLHTRSGLLAKSRTAGSKWSRRWRGVLMPLGVLLPITLGAMALAGYHYTALQLEYRLNSTLLLILLAVVVHAFFLRWLTISQRRLSMKMALEKRAALMKSREAGDEDLTAETLIESLEQIDVAEIKEQTQDLLRMSVGLGLLVGLYFVWVGVLPALKVLDNYHLGNHEVMGPDGPVVAPITLASLGLALFLVVLTLAAARNMPGFLEIAVLQRLHIEPGARYAIRTLMLYAIVSTGIVVAFNAIGVGWTNVQWLVAALTVGLGFGLQEIFANFVSGLIILLERPVRVGDTVTVGSVSGVVSRIRMRATTITDWSRRELVVPNKSFITGEIINWSLSDPILRLQFVVGIAYGSDTTKAHRTMLDVCRRHPMVLEQPEPNVFFVGFGESSLDFEVRIFVSEPTNVGRTRILHDLHMAIDQGCRQNSIEIAFPQRDLHIRSIGPEFRVRTVGPEESAARRD